jgi:dynein heavy chain, axonemal
MSKIVQAIDKLEFRENSGGRPTALSFKSCVGIEEVRFANEVPLEGKVELYLQVVHQEMITTITVLTKNAYQTRLSMDRVKFIDENKSQVILLTNMIYWVRSVEEAFVQLQAGSLEAMKNYYEKSVELLTDLIRMVQGELTKAMRQKVMTLITMDTHSRDMVEMLIKENVRKEDDFQWQKQLKMYWHESRGQASINVADACIWYGSEYLGNGARLVVTPLTDRIYVTATQALHLKMGCAPAGPAGTGKTETTKDLASACGKACYVFNCSPEMDYISMGNTYKGLASSGSWGCFDEFNRLNPEVLSVCSVQFKQVTDAIKAKLERFKMEGDEIGLDPTCGAFITMNPGYLGRSELPKDSRCFSGQSPSWCPTLNLFAKIP